MYINLSSSTVGSDSISVTALDKKYHSGLGIMNLNIGAVGNIYIDYDSAVKIRDGITQILDEYLADDTATYSTSTLDPEEVQ